MRKYGYRYDKLNRLLDAYYQKPNDAAPLRNSYNEHLAYDRNGNIQTLTRNGDMDDDSTVITIDALEYTYDESDKNRLLKVKDNEANPSGFKDSEANEADDYTYDGFGNMVSDRNKNITEITYNHLNLPLQIFFTYGEKGTINYLYTGSGEKVRKAVKSPRSRGGFDTNITDYLDGYQYYDSNLQFFPTAEGYVDHTVVDNVSFYNYVYQYKDHLGNIRMNYAIDPHDNVLKIKEENHYYPFGLKHQNYLDDKREFREFNASVRLMASFTEGGSEDPLPPFVKIPYNYKYQEQERQEELGLNWDSFKWRNYDYAIGRFMSIDPLAMDYVYNSPYAFQENKMGMGRELEGLELVDVHDDVMETLATMTKDVQSAASSFGNWLSETFSEGTPERSSKDISVSLRSKDGGGNNPTTTGAADDHWNVDGLLQAGGFAGAPLPTAKNGKTDATKVSNTIEKAKKFAEDLKEGMDAAAKAKEAIEKGSALITVKYEEYSATGTVGINSSKVHKNDKDSTIIKSNVQKMKSDNAKRKQQAIKQVRTDNIKRFGHE